MIRWPLLRNLLLTSFASVLALLDSCAPAAISTDASATTRPYALPADHEVPGVSNFAQVSPALYRGAQPDAQGFASLKKMGIKTVVNLRSGHSDRDMLKGTGLQYVHLPCAADRIDQNDIAQVMKIVRDPECQPVFVHCQHGSDRTGLAVGIYRIVEQNWTADQTEAELRAFGYHWVYRHILQTIRLLSKDHFNALVEKAPRPKIETIR